MLLFSNVVDQKRRKMLKFLLLKSDTVEQNQVDYYSKQ